MQVSAHSLIIGALKFIASGLKLEADRGTDGSANEMGISRFVGRRRRFVLVDALENEAVWFAVVEVNMKVGCGGMQALCIAGAPGAGSAEERKANRFSVPGSQISF